MGNETELGALTACVKTGNERFTFKNADAGFDLKSFWQWSGSDLINNTMRGILAEYLVAQALGLVGSAPRMPWAKYDLLTSDGIKIEVKSAAYVQSWHQTKLSSISFGYGPKLAWDDSTGKLSDVAERHADVYVFAILNHIHKPTVDPLNIDQWQFYVVATAALDRRERSQHSITLNSLSECCNRGDIGWCGPVTFDGLREAVHEVALAK